MKMSLYNIFDISGSALKAQAIRLTTTASNMSNANVVSGNQNDVYRPRYPVFKTAQLQANQLFNESGAKGVEVGGVFESTKAPIKRYEPNNPIADKNGYVYAPNVNVVEEMTNMISASRSYQMNVEVMNTSKQLMLRTLQLGQ
jgi:flagellar basal-body rod protein FlgC